MPTCTFNNSRIIGENQKPYIVAEVNTSHNGNLDTAKTMIAAAKECGCDCVKFQSWTADTLYAKSYYKENPISKRFVTKFSFSEDELLEVAKYAREIGIEFSSTPYSKSEVDFLVEKCNVPFIKIASMDVNNLPFIEYIANTGVPIVLATGMSEFDEIEKAVSVIEGTGNKNLCILHCVSVYPAKHEILDLNNITSLKKAFPSYCVGFSDHSIGAEAACASIAMGAALIEKHFTLDSSKIGMDNQMATEPEQMKKLVESCHNVHLALGKFDREITNEEKEQQLKMRRSVIVTRDLKAGDTLTAEDLDAKRPASGMPPTDIPSLIGKTLSRDIEADTLLTEDDII